jgi:hypothetical protein
VRYAIGIVFIFIIKSSIFSQHDADTLINILKIWNLSDDLNKERIVSNDTSLDLLHVTRREEKQSFLSSNLGNIASAYIPNIFFKRNDSFSESFFFNNPYFIYIKNSDNVNFYNTRRPYTSLFHTTSTKVKDIQTIELIHTQNINPFINFGINYDFITSAGEYSKQTNKINTVALTGNVSKLRYSGNIAYIFNKFNFENSGGYKKDTLDLKNISLLPYMENSNTLLLNQELSITNTYRFGKYKNLSYKDTIIKVLEPSVSVSYHLKLERKYRIYKDDENLSGTRYTIFNFKIGNTYDSVGYKALVNKIKFGSEDIFEKKNKFGFSFLFGTSYYQIFNFKEYILLNNKNNFIDNSITGDFYTTFFKKIQFNVVSQYYVSGYRKNDFKAELTLNKQLLKNAPRSEISIKACFYNKKPDYFYISYYSNHRIWENDFVATRSYDMTLDIKIPEYALFAEFETRYLENYVWFGSIAVPQQYKSGIAIFSFYGEKDFNYKVFNIDNKIAIQHSSNPDIISLPIFAIYHSLYFKLLIKNSLLLHIGYDVNYATSYKALSFDPSAGQFYLENNTETAGNYPYIGVFVNGKIKKNVFLFINFSHVNSSFLGSLTPVNVNDYPVYGRLFKFGIKWIFKN